MRQPPQNILHIHAEQTKHAASAQSAAGITQRPLLTPAAPK